MAGLGGLGGAFKGGFSRGAAIGSSMRRAAGTRRGKFAMGAGIGMGGMYAAGRMRGRSSGANGISPRSSGGMTGM